MTSQISTEVVGIGSCGVDYFAIVPHLLGPDEKINVGRTEIHAGGVTGNNLTQVARLGATAGWLGLLGDDEFRRIQRSAHRLINQLAAISGYAQIAHSQYGKGSIEEFSKILDTVETATMILRNCLMHLKEVERRYS